MTVAFATAGAAFSGTTSVSLSYPTGIAAGDLLLLGLANKYPANGPSTPAGWTLLSQESGGAGASGVDSGSVYATVYWRIADGTETGSLNVSFPSGNACLGQIIRYTKTDAYWDIASTSGTSNTPGTAWSATGSVGIGINAGDIVLVISSINNDLWTFANALKFLTTTGVTFGTRSQRAEAGTTQGDDIKLSIHEYPATAGSSSSAPSFAMTANGSNADSPAGCTVFVRLRDIALAGTGAAAAGASGSAGGAGAVAGTVSTTVGATGALGGTAARSGSATAIADATGVVVGVGAPEGSVPAMAQATGGLTAGAQASGAVPTVVLGTGGLTGLATLAGTAAGTTGAGGAATSVGAPAGTTAVTVSATGDATGIGALAGTAAVNVSGTGDLRGVAEIAGTAAASVGVSGSAGLIAYTSGAANADAGAFGNVEGIGHIAGDAGIATVAALGLTGVGTIGGTADVHGDALQYVHSYVPRIVVRLRSTIQRGARLATRVERGVVLAASLERVA